MIKKTLEIVQKTYLRVECFTELHFEVLQVIKHMKWIIVHLIFVNIAHWYVTIRFPFKIILLAIIFIMPRKQSISSRKSNIKLSDSVGSVSISGHESAKWSRDSKYVEPKWIASKVPNFFQQLKMISLPSGPDMWLWRYNNKFACNGFRTLNW